jgi:hypothetical protein
MKDGGFPFVSIRAIRVKTVENFCLGRMLLALTYFLSAQERILPSARCSYSVAGLTYPDMGISKVGGNLDRGVGDKGI